MISFFPYDKPRKCQSDALGALASDWNSYDIFVLRIPVGGGKSAIAYSIAEYLKSVGQSALISVPNNILRTQYLNEFKDMNSVKGAEDYRLSDYGYPTDLLKNIKDVISAVKLKGNSKHTKAKRGLAYKFLNDIGNVYVNDLRAVKNKDSVSVVNNYSNMAHKLYKNHDCVIFDEAHQILPTLQDLSVKKLTAKEYGFPKNLKSIDQLYEFMDANRDSEDPKIVKLVAAIDDPNWSVSIEADGLFEKALYLKPISVKDEPTLVWNNSNKLVFMSATIGEADINRLNLGGRIRFLDFRSPIPAVNRPIIPMNIADMSRASINESLDSIVDTIKSLCDNYANDKGFIHVSYELALTLKPYLTDSRFVFMDKETKKEKFENFLTSDEPLVFVGSGMSEGIDLKYDKARFQIIPKIPYPSLADSRNKLILTNDPEYYSWQTAKELIQMTGRVCRAEDDKGTTYVLDKQWNRWYTGCMSMLPMFFKEGVVNA